MKFLKPTLVVLVLGIFSCTSNTDDYSNLPTISEQEILAETLNLPNVPFDYNVELPSYFYDANLQLEEVIPVNNAITNDGATLGRVLFYDTNLSLNKSISCVSCHSQETSFSDTKKLSDGFDGGKTGRNSMSLANARFYRNGRFFWDERALTLEEQVVTPIQDHIEMGMTLNDLEDRLNQIPQYKVLFNRAFGDSIATSNRIALALSQFVRSMVSYQSKFDVGLAQTNDPRQNFTNFTASENQGKNLFFSNRTNCAQCHKTAAFVGDGPRNNGLDAVITDLGLGITTGNAADNGKFKVPSLRNVGLTAPFMHDGRFASLMEVIEHYNSGVQESATLDNRLRQGQGNPNPRRLNLTTLEKQSLVDFLLTLTDTSFMTDEKYSSPFK